MAEAHEQPHQEKDTPAGKAKRRSAGSSIRPGQPVPPVVLIVDEGKGGVYLEGGKHGPQAFLITEDAEPLRQELARAYGTDDLTPRQDTRGDD